MRNYKARTTAQNMEITDYAKELLANLLIFATSLGDGIDESEANKTLSIISDWNPEASKDLKTIDDFKTLQDKKWPEEQDISDIIAIIVDILSNSSFFDIQESLKRTLKQYSMDFENNVPNATHNEALKIRFSNADFACQFYGDDGNGKKREISEAEKYANLMYLSNQLAHAFSESLDGTIKGVTNSQIQHIAPELRKIKDWSIHRLIEQKKQGQPIDIAISTDGKERSSNNGVISFALPNYIEPFLVHYNSGMLSQEELELCDGIERYRSNSLKTTFPQYLSDEKMLLLERVYRHRYADIRSLDSIRTHKLEWLFDTKTILDALKIKSKIRNTPSEKSKKLSGRSKSLKSTDIARNNAELFSKISEQLGVDFPKYFEDGFLGRTSYSVSQYMEDITPDIREKLISRGVPNEQVDTEIAKLMVYMKVVKPLSTIVSKAKPNRIEEAVQSLDEYGPIYDSIIDSLQSETSFSALRSKARRSANQLISEKSTNTLEPETIEEPLPEGEDSVETIDHIENIENKAEDNTGDLQLSHEQAQELINEIIKLNQEISDLSAIIEQSSAKLSVLQTTLTGLQDKLSQIVSGDSPENNDDKGDR